jgi:hypothetical protein
MKLRIILGASIAIAGLAVAALYGPEFIRVYRAQHDVHTRGNLDALARVFGLEPFVRPGLRLAAHTKGPVPLPVAPIQAKTVVSIEGENFLINGVPTHKNRVWNGIPVEGLLFNARMVQATFDDWNPDTVAFWAYPDTGRWDRERNTTEFVNAMPSWRAHGLDAITVNLQGGNAHGPREGWVNSAFDADGELHPAYFNRLRRVIKKADDLGMAVILGLFYFRNDEVLRNEAAVRNAVDRTVDWLHALGARNVLIEIDNECDVLAYDHDILRCDRVHELIDEAKKRGRDGFHFPVSSSTRGGSIPPPSLIKSADYILLHGNGVDDPGKIGKMVASVRASPGYRPMPIVFNEDDHYDFDKPDNNFLAATRAHASWGYFDRRHAGEPFQAGFQSVPVDWKIDHVRKRAFFDLVAGITGASSKNPPPE